MNTSSMLIGPLEMISDVNNINNKDGNSDDEEDASDNVDKKRGDGGSVVRLNVAKPAPSAVFDVEMGYRIYRIYNVDNALQSFEFDMRWFVTFCDPNLVGCEKIPHKSEYACFKPHLDFNNCRILDEVDGDYRISDSSVGRVHWHRRFRAVATTELVLTEFPFDVQLLSIVCRMPRALDRARVKSLEPDERHAEPSKCIQPFNMPEFNLHEPRLVISTPKNVPTVTVDIPVSRIPNFYLTNFCLVLFLITALGLPSLLLTVGDQMGDRMSIALTLVLTAVAFKFALTEVLPKTTYPTTLDYYVLMCYLFMFLLGVENAVVSIINRNNEALADDVDQWSLVCMAILWPLSNIVWYFTVRRRYNGRLADLSPLVWWCTESHKESLRERRLSMNKKNS